MTRPALSLIDSPAIRQAEPAQLSLALIDARNHTLSLLTALEQALGPGLPVPAWPELLPPCWLVGHIGWAAEFWIARHPQRSRGPAADPLAPRLPSVEPAADRWWDPTQSPRAARWALDLPPTEALRAYLLQTLEATLELLDKTSDDDDALYFYRWALLHEDQRGEQLLTLAQTLNLALPGLEPPSRVVRSPREPLALPALRGPVGLPLPGHGPGFVFDAEAPQHSLALPPFEIDAQAVSWAQFLEFVADGGYDEPACWHPSGWQWLQALASGEGEVRRGPRHVTQMGVARLGGAGAVLQQRFGQTVRMAGGQPATHLSWWEADAWCRWAGRRLPSEAEWELAARQAGPRGFHWGEVWEWTASPWRPYPGARCGPLSARAAPPPPAELPWRVLRGASVLTHNRLRHPSVRRCSAPTRDDTWVGFRSCAL